MELKKRIYSKEIKERLEEFVNKEIIVSGWVEEIRDLGSIKFIVLRDREGYIQLCLKKGKVPNEIIEKVKGITRESVLAASGIVINNKIAPNGFEIFPNEIEILSPA
ncbi:OB-fold nucleic acid binding domain-containing protein, partial [Belliella pelovolcani]|uniref:OB-fold nucleic acid binding domain-containing protein n=1 Tax=Belliella pelovolcani TaxID=529505 RepID=UPI00391A15D1